MITHKFTNVVVILCYLTMICMFALNNTFDFDTNYKFVQHVLTMDTTANVESIRAIHNPKLHLLAYCSIIIWQYITFCIGAIGLKEYYVQGTVKLINLSIVMAIALYFLGYTVIASEWFMMWQSTTWNAQSKAINFTMMFMLVHIFVNRKP